MSVFGSVGEDTLNFFLQFGSVASNPTSDYFFRQGDRAFSIFVLETGKVAALKAREGRL